MSIKPLLRLIPLLLASTQVHAETHVVKIEKFQFIPQMIRIKAGDTVRWENHEKRQYHSVWFEQLGEPEPPYFFPDESVERRFDEAGTFPYRCGPHPRMTGTVQVE